MHTLFRTPSGPRCCRSGLDSGPGHDFLGGLLSRCPVVSSCGFALWTFLSSCGVALYIFLCVVSSCGFALDSPTCRLFLCFWRMFLYPSSRRFLRLFQWPLPLSTPPPSEFQCLHPTLLCPPHHISSLSIAVNFGHVLVSHAGGLVPRVYLLRRSAKIH